MTNDHNLFYTGGRCKSWTRRQESAEESSEAHQQSALFFGIQTGTTHAEEAETPQDRPGAHAQDEADGHDE